VQEKEQASGYDVDSTAAPDVSDKDRKYIMGSSSDAFARETLMSTAIALRNAPVPDIAHPHLTAAVSELGGEDTEVCLERQGEEFLCLAALAQAAEEQDSSYRARDIWNDANTPAYVQHHINAKALGDQEHRRVVKRAKQYEWLGSKLFRTLGPEVRREVPPVDARIPLVQQLHTGNLQLGKRRLTHLVLRTYWWHGVYQDVKAVLTSRQTTPGPAVTPSAPQEPALAQLLMNSWGPTVLGPYAVSKRGNQWVLVCIEHHSRWMEAFPMRTADPEEVTYHFIRGIWC
jgi:hypothetical protein